MNAKIQKIMGFDAEAFFGMSNHEYFQVLKAVPENLVSELNKEERYALANDDLASAGDARGYYGSNNRHLKGEAPKSRKDGTQAPKIATLSSLEQRKIALEKAISENAQEIQALTEKTAKELDTTERAEFARLSLKYAPVVSRAKRK